jgi:uncharacterized protein (DUF2235 family)
MGTRIILLSDGTGNSAAKVWRTNVWRIFEALDLTGSDQIACYDDGVGTSSFKPLAILGGGFGWGLKRNVIDLYKFVCRNYRSKEDEIFGFGFSRGAFTIRIVAGLILHQGLVPYKNEADLDQNVKSAYRAYRADNFHSELRIEKVFRWLRNLFLRSPYDRSYNIPAPQIRFLGLWDTVAAYGLPVEEMTRGVSQWIWPLELPTRTPPDGVVRGCHALSLDDERTTFHPILWNERNLQPAPVKDGARCTTDERLTQVWFSGVHANVGGGYPDDSLAQIPLVWIMNEAIACGLKFKKKPCAEPDALLRAESARDKDGRLYDSRHGLAGYYRYGPRKLAELCNVRLSREPGDEVHIEKPKIHETVFKRMQTHARAYAPIGLPPEYEVVTEDGHIVPSSYETPDQARNRSRTQEHVWNLVWWRRVVYFATVFASFYFAIYPLTRALPPSNRYTTALHPVSDILGIFSRFLPNSGNPWISAYEGNPGRFVTVVLIITGLMWISTMLQSRVLNSMAAIWERPISGSSLNLLPTNLVYRLRTHPIYKRTLWTLKRHIAPALFAILFVWLGLGLIAHTIFVFEDAAGLFCPKNPSAIPLNNGQRVEFKFAPNQFCVGSGFILNEGSRYTVSVKRDGSVGWQDGKGVGAVKTTLAGFRIMELPVWQRPIFLTALPLKRDLIRPWFRIILRVGSTGTYEDFLDPDPRQHQAADDTLQEGFTPKAAGELFVYVNDVAIPIPYVYDYFYWNNRGQATVTVQRR